MKTIDQLSIRKQNISRVWDVLDGRAKTTRQELAEKTGLSLMTVTNLVDHLGRYHALDIDTQGAPASAGRKTVGRHAEVIRVNQRDHAWLLFDLTDRHFRFYTLALDKQVLYASPAWGYDVRREYAMNLLDFLRRCRAYMDAELKKREILGVGVVVPGPYDIDSDTVRNQRVPELNALCVKDTLRREIGMYDYYVDEDVKFAVRAYIGLAAMSDSELLYYLYIGEGVGGAQTHVGNVLRGLNAAAGDAGQLLMADGKPYESALSLRAFAEKLGIASSQDQSEDALLSAIDQKAFANAALYRQKLAEQADITARMLHNVVWILDPKQIVIDCRYARLMEDEFFARVRSALAARLAGALSDMPELLPAKEERRSVLLGAAQVLCREWIERIV